LPAAIGAQVARPDAHVVAIVGDGGLQMTMHEFATLRRYELPVKILVLDNRHLGMVRQWQELFFDRRVIATDLWDNPDFCAIARAYGVRARRIDRPEHVHDAVAELLKARDACLLHCACFPTDNCFPMIPPGKHVDDIVEEAV
jgi:acetolactate synthase-1/2/3 large subunit